MILSILIVFFAHAAAPEPFHICYFSLNNEKEFTEMEKFTKKLNKHSKLPIVVHEFQDMGADPKESFEAMMEKQPHCDGLVISGHHTGGWGGERASAPLNLDFLEKMSCSEKFQKWFSKVNSVWLQGCRTLGIGDIINESVDADMANADFHTQRVGAVLEEDNLTQTVADLNMEFSATLDQDNPLSSRYLRIFPRAKVFGWTKSAPGVNSQSEHSIPFHMAHISRLIQKDYPADPVKNEFNKETAEKYFDALTLALSNLGPGDKACEELLVDAWKNHGQKNGPAPYSFNNPDLQAFSRKDPKNEAFGKKIKYLECRLRNAETEEEVKKAIEALTSSEDIFHRTFNALWAKLQDESGLEKVVTETLSTSPIVKTFLEKKFSSNQTGLLTKMDYYSFYRDIFKARPEVEEGIVSSAMAQLNKKLSTNDFALRDYKQTIIWAMKKNELLAPEKFQAILSLENLDAPTIKALVDNIPFSKDPAVISRLLRSLVASPKNDDESLAEVIVSLSEFGDYIPMDQKVEIFRAAITSSAAGKITISRSAAHIPSGKESAGLYKILRNSGLPGDHSKAYLLENLLWSEGALSENPQADIKFLFQNIEKKSVFARALITAIIGSKLYAGDSLSMLEYFAKHGQLSEKIFKMMWSDLKVANIPEEKKKLAEAIFEKYAAEKGIKP